MGTLKINEYVKAFTDSLRSLLVSEKFFFLLKTSNITLPELGPDEKSVGEISDAAKILFILWIIAQSEEENEEDKARGIEDLVAKESVSLELYNEFISEEGYIGFLQTESTALLNLFWTLVREEFPDVNKAGYFFGIREGWVVALTDQTLLSRVFK